MDFYSHVLLTLTFFSQHTKLFSKKKEHIIIFAVDSYFSLDVIVRFYILHFTEVEVVGYLYKGFVLKL